jgi:leader peptidase (prepilin peptidase)/N-methyltransferase
MLLSDLPPVWIRAIGAALGLIWGSFLNVVIHRVPREMSVVRPGSTCPTCGKPIAAWDNVPVFSWLLLGGRARCCKTPISARYPLVELLCGFVGLAIVDRVIGVLPGDTTMARGSAIFVADFALSLGLIAAAFIDFEHMYLPDTVTIGGTILGVATASFRGFGWSDSLIGVLAGFLGIYAPFTFLYKKVFGRTGMGVGDAKLCALAGAWFGWHGGLFVLFAGAIQGVVAAGAIYLLRGKIEEPDSVRKDREELERLAEEGDAEAKQLLEEDPVLGEDASEGWGRMPFGPFLILAILELLLFGRELSGIGATFIWGM